MGAHTYTNSQFTLPGTFNLQTFHYYNISANILILQRILSLFMQHTLWDHYAEALRNSVW